MATPPGKTPGTARARRLSWLPASDNSVHPLPNSAQHVEPDFQRISQQTASTADGLVFSAATALQYRIETRPAAPSTLTASTTPHILSPRSILRSRSSVTAAPWFESAESVASSEDDDSLAAPDDLVESAMFLLRDKTLADPDAEVSCTYRLLHMYVMHVGQLSLLSLSCFCWHVLLAVMHKSHHS